MRRLLKWLVVAVTVFIVLAAVPAGVMKMSCESEAVETATSTAPPYGEDVTSALAALVDYLHEEERTFLTFPEWFIVYVSQDYGEYLEGNRPSGFPYFSATWDFWSSYCGVTRTTTARYPMNWGAHVMIYVIGVSHSVEYLVKGIYENTIGRLFELLAFGAKTQEDRYAQRVAAEYGEFLNTTPWYEFPFSDKLFGLWQETDYSGDGVARKWERKIVLTIEYALKTAYGSAIRAATAAAYAPAKEHTVAVIGPSPEAFLSVDNRIEILERFDGGFYLVQLPRYRAFSEIARRLASRNVPFVEIAGNDEILVTALMREGVAFTAPGATRIFSMTIATRPGRMRDGFTVTIPELTDVLRAISRANGEFEHAYDY
jgi:hypothetical protein